MPYLDTLPADALVQCKDCGVELPPLDMTVARKKDGRIAVTPRCKPCENQKKRAHERRLAVAARSEDGALVEAVAHGDPEPARLLGVLMREHRADGRRSFQEAWMSNLALVLRQVSKKPDSDGRSPRAHWREAFEGTRSAWEAAWYGEAGPGRTLTTALLAGALAA